MNFYHITSIFNTESILLEGLRVHSQKHKNTIRIGEALTDLPFNRNEVIFLQKEKPGKLSMFSVFEINEDNIPKGSYVADRRCISYLAYDDAERLKKDLDAYRESILTWEEYIGMSDEYDLAHDTELIVPKDIPACDLNLRE